MKCKANNCNKEITYKTLKLCNAHARRHYRYGDPNHYPDKINDFSPEVLKEIEEFDHKTIKPFKRDTMQ